MDAVVRWLRVRHVLLTEARAALGEHDVVVLRRGMGLRVVSGALALLGVLAAAAAVVGGPLAPAARVALTPALLGGLSCLLVDLLLEHHTPSGVALGRRGVWLGGSASSRGPAEVVPWSQVATMVLGSVDAYATTRHVVGGHVVWGGTRRPPLEVGVRVHDVRPRSTELDAVLDQVGVAAGRSVHADADALGLGTVLRSRPVGLGAHSVERRLTRALGRLAPQVPLEHLGGIRLRSEDEIVAQLGRRVSRALRGRPPTRS